MPANGECVSSTAGTARPTWLTADPATGIFRHVDAGYEKAIEVGKERGVKVPE